MDTQVFKNKKILIVHGYHASSQSHWFPWLKAILEQQGATVYIPNLPNSSFPDPVEWLQCLEDMPFSIDEYTLCIGHSLGCITLLKFLDTHKQQLHKIGGYILVSGFSKIFDKGLSSEEFALLQEHTNYQLDYKEVMNITDHRVSIVSSNDYLVTPDLSLELAKALHTKIVMVENAGHFLGRDGYYEFHDILSVLQTMIFS